MTPRPRLYVEVPGAGAPCLVPASVRDQLRGKVIYRSIEWRENGRPRFMYMGRLTRKRKEGHP